MSKTLFICFFTLYLSNVLTAQSAVDYAAAERITGTYLGHYGTENDLELEFNRIEIQSLGLNKVVILCPKFEPIAAEVFLSTDSTTHLVSMYPNTRLRYIDKFQKINIRINNNGIIRRYIGNLDYKNREDSLRKYPQQVRNNLLDKKQVGQYAGIITYDGKEYPDTLTIIRHNVPYNKNNQSSIQLGFRITSKAGFFSEIFTRARTFYETQESVDFENEKYNFRLSGDHKRFYLETEDKKLVFEGIKI